MACTFAFFFLPPSSAFFAFCFALPCLAQSSCLSFFANKRLLFSMFKRVAKATSKKADVDEIKDATGDDTAIGIDRLVDESSSSEGEDSEDDDQDSDQEEDDDDDQKAADSSAEDEAQAKAGSKRKRTQDEQQDDQALAAAQVSIEDAIRDPIYVPTEGEKKHGVLASRCIICGAAVLKTPHLVTAHLDSKAHQRRMRRFQRYVQDELSETQRKALDARDAIDQMDAWKAEQDEIEKKRLADAPPSQRKLAKQEKAAEIRKKKKEMARRRVLAKKQKAAEARKQKKELAHKANPNKNAGGDDRKGYKAKRNKKAASTAQPAKEAEK